MRLSIRVYRRILMRREIDFNAEMYDQGCNRCKEKPV